MPRRAKDGSHRLKDAYKSIAPYYDLWASLFESRAKARLLELLELKNGTRILDLGVGTGHLFESIVSRNPSGLSAGIDSSQPMLARARKKLSKHSLSCFQLLEGDVLNLPPALSGFDAIVSSYLIELISPDRYPLFFKAIECAAAKQATVLLSGMIEEKGWKRAIARRTCQKHPAWNGGFRTDLAQRELELLGFRVDTLETVSQFGFPTAILRGKRER